MNRVAMLLGHDFLEPSTDFRVYREACSLVEAGFEVEVYCWARRNMALEPETQQDGIVVKRLFEPLEGGFLAQAAAFRRAMLRLGAMATTSHPQVIHAHDLETLPSAVKAARRCGAKVIFDAHEDWPLLEKMQNRVIGAWMALQQRRWLPKADAILTVSPELAERFGGATVLYNSEPLANVETPSKQNIRADLGLEGVVAGYIGGLRWTIMEELLEVVAQLPELHLLVVGGPPKGRAGYEKLIPQLQDLADGIGARATFTGSQPYESIGDYYHACDLLLVGHYVPEPLRPYAVPKKLLDGMAYGLPVVVGPYSARRKIVEANDCGIVTSDWKAAIQRLAGEPTERNRLGANGKAAFKEQFCWELQTVKLLNVYSKLLGSNQGDT